MIVANEPSLVLRDLAPVYDCSVSCSDAVILLLSDFENNSIILIEASNALAFVASQPDVK
jgi:hypothetical protein